MNQKTLYFLLSIVASVALLKFLSPNTFQNETFVQTETETVTEDDTSEDEAKPFNRPNIKPSDRADLKILESLYNQELDIPFHNRARSEKQKAAFVKRTFLEIPDMDDFLFEDYSQDDVAVLVGKNNNGSTMTILASRSLIDPKNINQLIMDNPELFPLSDPQALNGGFTPALSIDRKMNGFSGASVYKKEASGKVFASFYAPREDGKGAYGIMLEGSKENVMGNYDYYEKKLLQFKARPD